MKNSRAFTLIEVMVVLSILALIAILAYNFFGGTMKEATLKQQTTKTYNDLRVVVDAMDLYYIKNGAYPGSTADLVTDGYLKSLPTGLGTLPISIQKAMYDSTGTATKDDVVRIGGGGISDDQCKAYNDAYTSLGATIPDNAGAVGAGATLCAFWDGEGKHLWMVYEAK